MATTTRAKVTWSLALYDGRHRLGELIALDNGQYRALGRGGEQIGGLCRVLGAHRMPPRPLAMAA